MMESMKNVESIDMDVSTAMDIDMSEILGMAMNTVVSGNIKQVIRSETDIDMAAKLNMRMLGMTTPTTMYFTGGVLYMEMEMLSEAIRYSMPASFEDAMSQVGTDEIILDFPEDAIKDFSIGDRDGGRKIEFTLDGEALTNLTTQAMEVMEASLSPYGVSIADLNMDIGDVINEVVIDADGMLKSYRMTANISMAMEIEGETITMSMAMDTSITVNSYNDVTINFPDDLDEWDDAGTIMNWFN
jgi:hypothetical protein